MDAVDVTTTPRSHHIVVAEALEAEMQRRAEAELDRQNLDEYARNIRAGFEQIPETCKYVRRMAKKTPDRAVWSLIRVANEYAKQHKGEPAPSPRQLAEYLEKSLVNELSPFLEDDDPKGSSSNHRDQARSEAKPKAPPATLGASLVGTHRPGGRADEDDDSVDAIVAQLKAGKHLEE